jgi:hypothetical protein
MNAIFYDRRNNREVSSAELMPINLVYGVITVDVDDPDFKKYLHGACLLPPHEKGGRNVQLGEYGYKSENCEKYKNWDLYCMLTDLVFLRLEDD